MSIATDPAPTSPATREWTLVGADGSVDVEVTAREGDTLAAVLAELGPALGRAAPALWAGSSLLPDALPLTADELRHGAVLGLGHPVPATDRTQRSSALELRVVGGPAAGRTVPLAQGRHVLGRGREASILLDDPDVSRQHVEVRVGGGAVTVADLGSTNGSRLGDQDLDDRPRPWPTGELLRLGASAVSLAGATASAAGVDAAPGGRLRLRPAPRLTTPMSDVEVPFPAPPSPPPTRRLAWMAIVLPAVGGLLMALLLRTPTFLFFALLSPVVALGTWISERWSGRRTGRREAAAHALALAAADEGLAAALTADVRATEAAHPDLAALTSAAHRRSSLLWSRTRRDADALTVRAGTGPAETRVVRVSGDGTRTREGTPSAPAVVDLRESGGLAVVGPPPRTSGVLRALVAQLAALHAPGEVDLLLLTAADRSGAWAWARWLPHLRPGAVHLAPTSRRGAEDPDRGDDEIVARLAALTARRRGGGSAGSGGNDGGAVHGWLIVIVDRPVGPALRAALRRARASGVLTLSGAESSAKVCADVDAVLRLTGETGDTAVLSRAGRPDRTGIVVDRLPLSSAAELARDLAVLVPAGSGAGLPRSVRLLDLPSDGLPVEQAGVPSGTWSRTRNRLLATVGATAHGPLDVDLCSSGPHALVAGTTGSGKSELLQTLIAGLARSHPPDRCSFLLIDYKGGAAFAEAAVLPHTVGLLTDLDGQSTARALRSLAAELTRREEILAAHAATDIADLDDSVELARLVIVVDEFATLAEELPTFVPGLVGIAQRGRSLGIHLVLATQRPSGVVSPEIRANCTLRICLRTTDEADSRDVLGTPDAALLPIDVPGRAFLRAGSGRPTAFQVARVASAAPDAAGAAPSVRLVGWPRPVGAPVGDSARPGGAAPSDLARLCSAARKHAERSGARPAHRPWRPPLPEQVTVPELDGFRGPSPRLPLGLLDRPDQQLQEPLCVDLDDGGTWLAVGGPRSGRTTLLRTALREAVHRLDPDTLHVHVIESGGGSLAAEASLVPHTGTAVQGGDAYRTARLVERLGREVAARRTDDGTDSTGRRRPLLLLLIDGIEAVIELLDEVDPGRGSATLLRLLREGASVGLTCVATADRAVPGGRLAALARQRLVLPLPDPADYAVAGVPARSVPGFRPPGRALVGEEATECQLAVPRELDARPGARPWPRSGRSRPLRIPDLPADAVLPTPRPGQGTDVDALTLPIGPGGDEGETLLLDLRRTGGLLVTGPGGSGRSTALQSFARHLAATCDVLFLSRAQGPLAESATALGAPRLDPGDASGTSAWLAERENRPAVVIADDMGSPAEWGALSALPPPGAGPPVALIAASGAGQLSGHYQGAVAALRRNRSALLLCPGPGDAELVGARLPRTPLPERPGSGWLVTGSGMARVQVAIRTPAPRAPLPEAATQSRSSAGPISWLAYQASS